LLGETLKRARRLSITVPETVEATAEDLAPEFAAAERTGLVRRKG
jgi:hypothetical protein